MNILKQLEQYTDREVIAKILSGEISLYEIIIRRYNSCLYKTARAYGYRHEDAEDLMQDTYISAYTHLANFEGRSAFKTWLIRIMLNHCYQKKQRFSFLKEAPAPINNEDKLEPMFTNPPGDTGKTVINRELNHVLENALVQIPRDYRMVFLLRELNELSVAETAETLQITESNVKTRLNRAKNMLRKEIEKMYSPGEIFEFNLVYCDGMVNRVMAAITRPSPPGLSSGTVLPPRGAR